MAAGPAFAAEPLVGMWQMIFQKVGKSSVPPSPLAIHISESNGTLRFDYLLNRELTLQRSFSVRPDGPPGVIADDKGSPLGTARLSKISPTEYNLVLKRPNRAPEPGKLTITEKGSILRCESDGNVPGIGPSHIVQEFARQTAAQ